MRAIFGIMYQLSFRTVFEKTKFDLSFTVRYWNIMTELNWQYKFYCKSSMSYLTRILTLVSGVKHADGRTDIPLCYAMVWFSSYTQNRRKEF